MHSIIIMGAIHPSEGERRVVLCSRCKKKRFWDVIKITESVLNLINGRGLNLLTPTTRAIK